MHHIACCTFLLALFRMGRLRVPDGIPPSQNRHGIAHPYRARVAIPVEDGILGEVYVGSFCQGAEVRKRLERLFPPFSRALVGARLLASGASLRYVKYRGVFARSDPYRLPLVLVERAGRVPDHYIGTESAHGENTFALLRWRSGALYASVGGMKLFVRFWLERRGGGGVIDPLHCSPQPASC